MQEPSFSNSNGTVNFEGIVLNPGFTGEAGKILTINFKAKAVGEAALTFFSASVLANDGEGTNILTTLGQANFNLTSLYKDSAFLLTAPQATTAVKAAERLPAPQITSPTHPDPNRWYAKGDAEFQWHVTSDTTAVRLLASRIPNDVPTFTYNRPLRQKKVSGFEDGVWYFHAQLKNNNGWGDIAHFRFQIDTEKPRSFEIQEIAREDKTNPKARFIFNAEDKTSGIDYYKVRIDDGKEQIWRSNNDKAVFETPALKPGKHVLIAQAVDKAGNALANSADFIVEALKPPLITSYPQELKKDEILIVKGITYPRAQVVVWLQKDSNQPQNYIVRSGRRGHFTFIAEENLKSGVYKLWAEVIDARGAKSKPSAKITIAVKDIVGGKADNWPLAVFIVIMVMVITSVVLLAVIVYSWYRLWRLQRNIRHQIQKTDWSVRQIIKLRKRNIAKQIQLLIKGKSRLSAQEKTKAVQQLQESLDSMEDLVHKKIQDIDKKIK